MNPSLLYVFIGKTLQEYIYDSIYQSMLVCENTKIYVLIEDSLIDFFIQKIYSFDTFYFKNDINNIIVIPLEVLYKKNIGDFLEYSKRLNEFAQFREGFWINTTLRFLYIQNFIEIFHQKQVFHIENDVMLYTDLRVIKKSLPTSEKMFLLKDSSFRVIPSIVYFPDKNAISKLTEFILEHYKSRDEFKNDMQLLAHFSAINSSDVAFFNDENINNGDLIFDGAAIGQFLGGVDPRNVEKQDDLEFVLNNSTRGFVNETSRFKPNKFNIYKRDLEQSNIDMKFYFCKNKREISQIANLHIHSKQLFKFSSLFSYDDYDTIISGDRVIRNCDTVILTEDIFNFHKNLFKFKSIEDIVYVKDFSKINSEVFLKYIRKKSSDKKAPVKIFLYTHILKPFVEYISPIIDVDYKLYLHNSDHSISQRDLNSLKLNTHFISVSSQNVNLPVQERLEFLPIGIANSMWPHGDISKLYLQMSKTYNMKKTKNLYININPNTFPYRKQVLEEFIKNGDFKYEMKNLDFENYLKELSEHRFCLCVRGNGIDTHRFWESIYLGVIPVIINNKKTDMQNFVDYLYKNEIVFYEIREEEFSEMLEIYSDDFFNENLYRKYKNKELNRKSGKISDYV